MHPPLRHPDCFRLFPRLSETFQASGAGGLERHLCLARRARETPVRGRYIFPTRQGAALVKIQNLCGLPNANAKSQRFSYAISQIAPLPPVVAPNRTFKAQIAAGYAAFWQAAPQIALTSFLSAPKSQRFKSRLQDANATKSQTLAFYKSHPFSATKPKTGT